MEEWRPVEGTDGRIEVSNEGRVRSLLRGEPYILKATPDNKGYLRIRITLDRAKYSYKVHRIVAKAFIPNPDGYPQVNHKDGNKSNNRIENLEWVTNRQNVIHSFAMRAGEHNVSVKDMQYSPATMKINGKKIYLKPRSMSYRMSNVPYTRQVRPILKKPVIAMRGEEVMNFESVSEAERYFDSRHITAVLKGKRQHVKGWSFAYREGGDAYEYPGDRSSEQKTGSVSER